MRPVRPIRLLSLLLACLLATSMAPATAQRQPLSPAVLEELKKVAAVYSMIQTDYVTPIEGTVVMTSCLKGMVRDLDGQSSFMDKEEFEDFKYASSTDVVGIGVELVLRAGLPTVVSAIEGSAADLAGLRPKDYILTIDGRSMEEAELRAAIQYLRGKPGSTVNLDRKSTRLNSSHQI